MRLICTPEPADEKVCLVNLLRPFIGRCFFRGDQAHRVHDAIHPVPALHVKPSASILRGSAALTASAFTTATSRHLHSTDHTAARISPASARLHLFHY
jgi:hypothetical protein